VWHPIPRTRRRQTVPLYIFMNQTSTSLGHGKLCIVMSVVENGPCCLREGTGQIKNRCRVVLRAFRVPEKNGNLVVIIYTIIIIIIILLFVAVVYRSICIIIFVTISKQYIVTRVLERPSLHRDKPQS
jgi:hypothetical protein